MDNEKTMRLDERIYLIDGYDMGLKHRTGTYVIDEEQLTLVDTGPSPSVPRITAGLAEIGHTLDEVKYIIVTHVHLDHAGGAGFLLEDCPNATVVVHEKGARHLADPSRLTAGAKMVYGESFDRFFEPVVPIPEERLLIKREGDELELSPACSLKFLDTPGHANHHFSIYDPVSNGLFAGDTVGVRYEQLAQEGVALFLPSTSPNQFNEEAMRRAIERFSEMKLDRIYYGHFSQTKEPELALRQVAEWLDVFMEQGQKAVAEGATADQLACRLEARVRDYLDEFEIAHDHEVYEIIRLDLNVGSQGLLEALNKQ